MVEFEHESVRLTASNVKAFAHPLRVQVLGLLRVEGPATASELAVRLGLSSGALSYHLRQLERFGFVCEDESRGNRRDRWWRAVHRYTEFDSGELDSAAAEAGDAFMAGVIEAVHRSLVRAWAERPALPEQWQRSFNISDVLLRLTADEAEQLGQDLLATLRRYRRHTPGDPVPVDMKVVEGWFQVFPTAGGGTVVTESGSEPAAVAKSEAER